MAKKETKKRSGIGKVTIPIIAVLMVFLVVGNIACVLLSRILDVYVGLGEATITTREGAENWDTNYYDLDAPDAEGIDKIAKDVTLRIAQEGIVLMKNENGALPLSDSERAVSLMGRRSVDTVFGGTGSGAGDTKQCISMADAFTQTGFRVNDTLTKLYSSNLDQVPVQKNTMDHPETMTYYIGEFPQSYYTEDVTRSYAAFGDAAIVVLGRMGGEGMDFCTDLKATTLSGTSGMDKTVAETQNYQDGQHQLELSQEEKELIAHAEANFEKVIVVINSANVMEIGALRDDPQVDAILWLSYPGSMGNLALAQIISGQVNPSGHTVDTWVVDLTADPTFANTSPLKYTNVDKSNALGDSYVVEYEEGIYIGYRYYETVAADGGTFTVEGQSGKSYDEAVAYPFGHGLSYTSFTQTLDSVKVKDGMVNITVTVKNTGDAPGKDVIQVYYHAPYNPGGIEKSATVLAAYEKTELLQPGASAQYTLSYSIEDMASYDYLNERCYVLEAGDYVISLNRNAHELYGENCTYTHSIPKTIVYNASNPRTTEVEAQKGEARNLSEEAKKTLTVVAATNRFDDLNAQFVSYENAQGGKSTNFTRANFTASFPTAPTAADLMASEETIRHLGDYTPDYYNADDVAPTTGADPVLTVVALRGAAYDDPRWEMLLDQMGSRSMNGLIRQGNQGTPAVKAVGLPASGATDGPAGLKQYGGLGFGTSGNFNCSSTLTAATWNLKLAEEFGRSVGNEALLAGMNGWYAPGCDIHRSAFGGRGFEYYSEDPLVSGRVCAATVQGAASMGLTCYAKHFVLNDMDRHREENGFVVWCNEQALREIYAKAYEILVKEPTMTMEYLEGGETTYRTIRACTALMSSFNRIGDVWCGASKALLTDVLRGEWGFLGTVITDYNGVNYMHVEAGITAGNDLMLANDKTLPSKIADTKNPTTMRAMRKACKNILYTQVNSSTVNGSSDSTQITYAISPWKIWLMELDAGLLALIAVLVVITVVSNKKRRNNIQVISEA